MKKEKTKPNDVDGVPTYRDRQKSENKPKDQEKNNPEFAPRGNRIPVLERHSVDPSKDTVYRVGEYAPRGFYSRSQLNNNMSGTDANAIYQATHDQKMEGTWSDPTSGLVDEANRVLYEVYGPLLETNPASITNGYNAPQEQDIPLAPENEIDNRPGLLPNMLYDRNTPGGQAYNSALRSVGYKVNTGSQNVNTNGGMDAYVAGADAVAFPNSDLRLYEGFGTSEGIPQALLDMSATAKAYSELLQEYLRRNPMNHHWY